MQTRGYGEPWRIRRFCGLGPWPGHTGHGYMAPPPKIFLGSSPLGAVQEERALWGTLEAQTLGGSEHQSRFGTEGGQIQIRGAFLKTILS